jgi:hypothetical protein
LDTPYTSTKQVMFTDTPYTSTLQAMERDASCTFPVLASEKGTPFASVLRQKRINPHVYNTSKGMENTPMSTLSTGIHPHFHTLLVVTSTLLMWK